MPWMQLYYSIIATVILHKSIVFQVHIKLHGLAWAPDHHLKHHPAIPRLSAFPWLVSLLGVP